MNLLIKLLSIHELKIYQALLYQNQKMTLMSIITEIFQFKIQK